MCLQQAEIPRHQPMGATVGYFSFRDWRRAQLHLDMEAKLAAACPVAPREKGKRAMPRMERVREIEFIETVGDLRAALAGVPDDRPVCDSLDEAVMLTFWRDLDTGEEFIEIA